MREKGKGTREWGQGYLFQRDKGPPLSRGEIDTIGKWWYLLLIR